MSLTERLTLRIVAARGAVPAGVAFGQLMMQDDPLPALGDMMFWALIRPLTEGEYPLLRPGPEAAWPQRTLSLTPLGERVLRGEVNYLPLRAQPHWAGGVSSHAPGGAWVVNEAGVVTPLARH